jgi:hypothetical protein
MDAIKILRQRAADKRDRAIKTARSEFQRVARMLDELDQALGRETPPRTRHTAHQSNLALIAELMPKDKTFTIQDILGLLEAAHPDRSFPAATIRSEFSSLIDRGIIRRVRKAATGIVHWAAAECEVTDEPIAAMSMADAAEVILGEVGALTATELVVALKERGYRPDDGPRVMLNSLRDAFKRNRARFLRREDGRWQLSQQ